MKKLSFISLVIIAMLSGCATTPTASSSAEEVSLDRMYIKEENRVKTGERNASLTIVRDGGIWGAACIHRVSVDGKKVFALKPNEQATVYLKPQEYEVKVDLAASSLCPYAQVDEVINLEPNQQRTFRISSAMSLNKALTLTEVKIINHS